MLTIDLLRDPETVWFKDMRSLDPLDTTMVILDVVEDLVGSRNQIVRAFGTEDGPQALNYDKNGKERTPEQAAYLQEVWKRAEKTFQSEGDRLVSL